MKTLTPVQYTLIGLSVLALSATTFAAYSAYSGQRGYLSTQSEMRGDRGGQDMGQMRGARSGDQSGHEGRGQGRGGTSGEGRGSGHSEEMMSLSGIALSSVSESKKALLIHQYQEEKLAQDLYSSFATKYPNEQVFSNIAASESQHMASVKTLLDRYQIPTPTTGYGDLDSVYASLRTEGEASLQKALEVGLKVEMLDIDDIVKTIKATDNADIHMVFTNIGGASYNHLRGFSQSLERNALTSTIDISAYLSTDDLSQRGSLKEKIQEKLK